MLRERFYTSCVSTFIFMSVVLIVFIMQREVFETLTYIGIRIAFFHVVCMNLSATVIDRLVKSQRYANDGLMYLFYALIGFLIVVIFSFIHYDGVSIALSLGFFGAINGFIYYSVYSLKRGK